MRVKIELYPNKLKQLQEAVEMSGEMAAEAVLTDIISSQTIPKDTGELERNTFLNKLGGGKYRISSDTPYARRLYWHPEYNFRQDKNQYAGGLWLQPFVDGYRKKFYRDTFKKLLKKNAKGLIK